MPSSARPIPAQVVAKLCFHVFNPALTFGKLVQAISVDSVKHLWPLLANMTLRHAGLVETFGACCPAAVEPLLRNAARLH